MLERALHRIFFVRETPFAIEVFFSLWDWYCQKKGASARARARVRGHHPNLNLNLEKNR